MKRGKVLCVAGVLSVAFLLTVILLFAVNPPQGMGIRQFSFVSWNVGDVLGRYEDGPQISYLLNEAADVAGVQEDFCKSIYNSVSPHYEYRATYNNCFNEPYSLYTSGLSVFSHNLDRVNPPQLKIESVAFRKWNNCQGLDCQAQKGFVLVKLFVPLLTSSGSTFEMPVHYYDLHLNAGPSSVTRRLQLIQLKSFMNTYSVGMSVIVAGDFNLSYQDHYDRDDLISFMNDQSLSMANDPNIPTGGSETIDYVLFRTGDSRESLQIPYCAVDEDSDGLSDHLALTAQIQFSANYDAYPDLVVTDVLSFEYDPLFDGTGKGIAQVVVKNEGPAAVSVPSPMYMTIQTIKYNNGIGSCPPLLPGHSAVVDVEYYTPQGQIPEYYTDVNIVVTADRTTDVLKGGLTRENNEKNNTLTKWVPIIWTTF